MSWEVYKTQHKGVGTLCEVYLNKEDGLIKRKFLNNGITVSGKETRFSEKEVEDFFQNEIKWLKRLESPWLPKTVDINHKEQSITQEFYNEDLLCFKSRVFEIVPDLIEQVLEMHRFFKKMNVFKRNGSLSNLTWNGAQLIAFDFKWANERPEGLSKEVYSYENYFVKIHPDLPSKLKSLL